MSFSFISIIMMLFSSGAGMNELLDVADPKSFFEIQQVEYTAAAMLEVLAEPPTKDFTKVKSQEVRKLLAMRALGNMKDASALPALKKALESKALFFDDYAAEAIAAIEGTDYVQPSASPEDMKKDLALLPGGIGIVMQARLEAAGTIDLPKMLGDMLKGEDGPKPEEVMQQINSGLGEVFKEIGNVRLDGVTLGLSADVGNDTGFVVVIARGKYDHRALESFVSRQGQTKSHQIGGTMFLGIDGDDAALAPVSNELLVFVSGPGWEQFPLDKVAAKLKARPAEPMFSMKLLKVLEEADQSDLVWGAGLISDGMKDAPPLAPFDQFVLSTKALKEGGGSKMKIDLVGSDAQEIAASFSQMEQRVQEGIREMGEANRPGMEPMLKLMKALKFDSKGLNGSISATTDSGAAGMLGLLLGGVGFNGL